MLLESRADMEFGRNVAEIRKRMTGEQDYIKVHTTEDLCSTLDKLKKEWSHIDQIVPLGGQNFLILYTK